MFLLFRRPGKASKIQAGGVEERCHLLRIVECRWSIFLSGLYDLQLMSYRNAHGLRRLLFRILLKVFFKSVVVEGAQFVPPKGHPWCVSQDDFFLDICLIRTRRVFM